MAGEIFGEVGLVTPVAPLSVNDVSYVTRINHKSVFFSWQVHYLVKFKCHFSCQVQYLVKFGMIAGARNAVFEKIKNSREDYENEPRLQGGLRTDGFMLGSFSDRPCIVYVISYVTRINHASHFFVTGAIICDVGRVTPVAPRIVLDVSYVTIINHKSVFSWQVHYLVKLNCHFSCQVQYLVQFGMIAGARNAVF